MIRIAAYAIATIVAALVLGTISERLISFDTAESVLLFGLVAGVINAFIKPIARTLALPITCLTFGLFALVVNAALFGLGAWLTPGIDVSWFGAFAGAIVASIASGIIFSVIDE
ncbi:MAG TPA: phage holin family protein [Thermomicrobiales bacterium]|jgi:putative membrane protein|nr:phage holin family protein [Thermomicrobiales bacterium]